MPSLGLDVRFEIEIHREIGRSGVVRAQILGFALPPASRMRSALPGGNIFCFGPPNQKSVLALARLPTMKWAHGQPVGCAFFSVRFGFRGGRSGVGRHSSAFPQRLGACRLVRVLVGGGQRGEEASWGSIDYSRSTGRAETRGGLCAVGVPRRRVVAHSISRVRKAWA